MMVLFFITLWIVSMMVMGINRTINDVESKKQAKAQGKYKYLDSTNHYRLVSNNHLITEYFKNNEWFRRDNITGEVINLTKCAREQNNTYLKQKAIERGDDLYLVRFPCDHNGYPNGKDFNIYGEHIITEQSPWYRSIKDGCDYIPRRIIGVGKTTPEKIFLIRVSDGKFVRPVIFNEQEEDKNEIDQWLDELNAQQEEYHKHNIIKYTWGWKYTTIHEDDSLEDYVRKFEKEKREINKWLIEHNDGDRLRERKM